MKPYFQFFFAILYFSVINYAYSQSYPGPTMDNFSGVHGVIFNPANVVGSPFKADINLVSGSAIAGSDYFGIDISNLTGTDGFDFDEDIEKYPKNDNNFFFNADVLGPSVLFNLNTKNSIAITTRVRGFMNIHKVSGELYESLEDGFDENEDFDFNMTDFNGTVHAWGEIGVTYGRILIEDETKILSAAASMKYLQGAGAVYFDAPNIDGRYTAVDGMINSNGNMEYGVSQEGFDTDDIEYKGLTSGFGFDLGATYQWNEDKAGPDSTKIYYVPYKLKIGLSLTDIGSINYKDGELTNYNLNQSVDKSEFDNKDFQDALDDNYDGQTIPGEVKIGLPTALNLMADYKFGTKWFASLTTTLSLNGKDKATANNAINTVTVSPRFETKWLSVYSQIGLRQHSGFAWGFGLRAGPFMIGSGSILSNLISDSSKSTDVYVGLKVPLYRRSVTRN